MAMALPIDFPDYPFARLLAEVACWAALAPDRLLAKQAELADAIRSGDRLIGVKALSSCCPEGAWDWPAYAELLRREFDLSEPEPDEEPPEPDRHDMLNHLYTKLVSRHMALYRKQQMDGLIDFRPYRKMQGPCLCNQPDTEDASDEGQVVLPSVHPFWEDGQTPVRCDRFYCRCNIFSLTLREYERGHTDAPIGDVVEIKGRSYALRLPE